MKIGLGKAGDNLQQMLDGAVGALPNVLLALVLLALFYVAARVARALVRKFTRQIQRRESVIKVLGRLTQWTIICLGVLVALSVVTPSFHAADLLKMLGIGGVASGFA